MCGILVTTDELTDPKAFEAGLASLTDRGPDDGRILSIGHGTMGFRRLAIMGLNEEGMQPFVRGGSATVCNGELYGFRPVKKRL